MAEKKTECIPNPIHQQAFVRSLSNQAMEPGFKRAQMRLGYRAVCEPTDGRRRMKKMGNEDSKVQMK